MLVAVMTLAELERHEQVALLGLLGLMARLDLETSVGGEELLHRVISDLQPDQVQSLVEEAAQFKDAIAILKAAEKVLRPEAREVIYEHPLNTAVGGRDDNAGAK